MDGWMDGETDEWIGVWMDGKTDKTKLTTALHKCAWKLTQTQREQFQSSCFGDILDTTLHTVLLQPTPIQRGRNVTSQQYSQSPSQQN